MLTFQLTVVYNVIDSWAHPIAYVIQILDAFTEIATLCHLVTVNDELSNAREVESIINVQCTAGGSVLR